MAAAPDFDRSLNKITYMILGKLNEVRPEAPLANKAFIESIRALFHRKQDSILRVFHENRSKNKINAEEITQDLLGKPWDIRQVDMNLTNLVVFLLFHIVIKGRAEREEAHSKLTSNLLHELTSVDPAFFSVRDAANELRALPPCTVCGNPAPLRCERCVQLHRPDTPYCSVDCQTRDWPTHRAKHIVPPIEHVSRKQRKSRRKTRNHRS